MIAILAATLAVSVAPVDIIGTEEGGALAALETAAQACDYHRPEHINYLRHALADRFNLTVVEIDRIITMVNIPAFITLNKNPAIRADFCDGIKRIKLPDVP